MKANDECGCARRQFTDELFGVINDTSKRQMELEEYLLLTFIEGGVVDLACLSFGELRETRQPRRRRCLFLHQ